MKKAFVQFVQCPRIIEFMTEKGSYWSFQVKTSHIISEKIGLEILNDFSILHIRYWIENQEL